MPKEIDTKNKEVTEYMTPITDYDKNAAFNNFLTT